MIKEDQNLLKDILSGMGGIRLDRMFEDCVELIEKFNSMRTDSLLDELENELEDVTEVVEEGRRGRKRKKKVRKGMGKKRVP